MDALPRDLTSLGHNHPVRLTHHRKSMGDQDGCCSLAITELIKSSRLARAFEVRCWLVGNEQVGTPISRPTIFAAANMLRRTASKNTGDDESWPKSITPTLPSLPPA